jgi:hypothetical protein
MRHCISLLSLLLSLPIAPSATIYLINPDGTGDFPTIQAAIDAATSGDIIELADGVFSGDGNRDIDYQGKPITVRSQSGDPGSCIIDCRQTGRGFYFHSHERGRSILEGLTITNGVGEGGGIYCRYNTSPALRNLILLRNSGDFGGGLACQAYSCPTLTDVIFAENSSWAGGGLACYSAAPVLTRVTFEGNTAAYGGGIYCIHDSSPLLAGVTFYESSAQHGGGIYCADYSSPCLESAIVAFGVAGEAIYCDATSNAILACCDLFGNAAGDWVGCIAEQYGVDGNISEDPLFCAPADGDFTLHCESPCAPFSPPNPQCNLIGAWPVGCGGTPALQTTWGGIKTLFRE